MAAALRDGKFGAIDAKEAVPGDVLRIKLGDEGYSGSIAKKGKMAAVVIATGNNTFFGRTASLVATRQQGRVPFGEGYRAGHRLPDLLLDRALHLPGTLRTLSRHRGVVRVAMGGHGRHRPNGAGPADRLHPGGGDDDDHGHQLPRGPGAGEVEGHRLAARGHRGAGGGRHPLLGQDRDADQEHPGPRRPGPVPGQVPRRADPGRSPGLGERQPGQHRQGGERGDEGPQGAGWVQGYEVRALRPGRKAHRRTGNRCKGARPCGSPEAQSGHKGTSRG